jgi:penicillin G amidase
MFTKITIALGVATLFILAVVFMKPLAKVEAIASIQSITGLQGRATVVRDKFGVPHVTASNDRDVYFMMGYLHAQDRFFQMDVLRRQGSGTLAELLGAGPSDQILATDIDLRLIGLRRAAGRALTAYSPQTVELLRAYSDGVNAWLDSNTLPPEYEALEITQALRWEPIDSVTVVKLLQFQNSFNFSDLGETEALLSYQAAGEAAGFDGVKLFFEDIFRYSPFDPTVTIPPQAGGASLSSQKLQTSNLQSRMADNASQALNSISPGVREAASKIVKRYKQNPLLNRDKLGTGSNWWIVAGSKTNTGNSLLANDPHLGLGVPAIFYEIHLKVDKHSSPMNVYGVSFAGIPGVFLGQNERISWGASTSSVDVTDFFTESLVIEGGAPVATRYRDRIEPLIIIPQKFRANQLNGVADDLVVISPGERESGLIVLPATFFSPRRNNGPVFPAGPTEGLSAQSTLWSATRDLDGIFALARARNISDFKRGLQFLEAGSFNWAYADVDGNIATFVNGKVPLREDLRSGTVEGLPPFFLRDGTGAVRNEWIPKSNIGPGVNYESVPFEEMPQAVNPPQGFLVNANNDPIGITLDNNPLNQTSGESIYYISSKFNGGFRAAKITSLLEQELRKNRNQGKLSFQDMKRIQSNVQMRDAEVFTPYLIQAFNRARRPGAPPELAALANDPGVREAIGRLAVWDFSAPTGIPQGYDGDCSTLLPFDHKASDSVAATIYAVWRSQILFNTIGATLQRAGLDGFFPGEDRLLGALRFLLDNFSTNQGVGASALDFFEIPGVEAPAEIRRDAIILLSLKNALSLLSSEQFAEAFGGSTNQTDYRWGKLHRITFRHPFGELAPQFSVPTAGNFRDLSPQLPGLAVDGGFETIDNALTGVLSASSQEFTFGGGPARRYIGELRRAGIKSAQVIPGGQSGVAGDQHHTDQLRLWLTNDYHDVFFSQAEILFNQRSTIIYRPAN